MTVLAGQQNQTRDSRQRLLDEGNLLTREKEKLIQRVATLKVDLGELETEVVGLAAKLDGYTAGLSSPLTRGLTDEEELGDSLGKEVGRRQKPKDGYEGQFIVFNEADEASDHLEYIYYDHGLWIL